MAQRVVLKDLAEMYVSFVARKHTLATIIFDGYVVGPSTKDVAHLRRSKGMVGRHVAFDPNTILCETKEIFLANCENKPEQQSVITFFLPMHSVDTTRHLIPSTSQNHSQSRSLIQESSWMRLEYSMIRCQVMMLLQRLVRGYLFTYTVKNVLIP